jgi:hypothetical protein
MGRVVSGSRSAQTEIKLSAFLRRFTSDERRAWFLAGAHDPAASLGARTDAAECRALYDFLTAESSLVLADSATQTAVNRLQTLGVLASGRPATILGAVAFEDRP